MALWMSWEVEGIASAGEDVRDMAGAVRALDASVDRIQRIAGLPEREARALREAATKARERLLSEGRASVANGRPWSVVVGAVRIRLTPRDRTV